MHIALCRAVGAPDLQMLASKCAKGGRRTLDSWCDPKRRKIAEGKILGGGHISIWCTDLDPEMVQQDTVVLHFGAECFAGHTMFVGGYW